MTKPLDLYNLIQYFELARLFGSMLQEKNACHSPKLQANKQHAIKKSKAFHYSKINEFN